MGRPLQSRPVGNNIEHVCVTALRKLPKCQSEKCSHWFPNIVILSIFTGYLYSFAAAKSYWPFVAFDMYATTKFKTKTSSYIVAKNEAGQLFRIDPRKFSVMKFRTRDLFNYLDLMKDASPEKYSAFMEYLKNEIKITCIDDTVDKVWIEKEETKVRNIETEPIKTSE